MFGTELLEAGRARILLKHQAEIITMNPKMRHEMAITITVCMVELDSAVAVTLAAFSTVVVSAGTGASVTRIAATGADEVSCGAKASCTGVETAGARTFNGAAFTAVGVRTVPAWVAVEGDATGDMTGATGAAGAATVATLGTTV